jgi:hypothetical protein
MISDPEKTLGQLFEALLESNAIVPSRKGPNKDCSQTVFSTVRLQRSLQLPFRELLSERSREEPPDR